MSRVAHSIVDGQSRSRDVFNDDNVNVDFASLLLSPAVQTGLESAGFERPSPIQLKAIPLGRCGLDLIVQAKSGTGKTCVFSVIALEGLDIEGSSTQALVLAPTREIAVQIQEVIHSIGSAMTGLRCHVFIGGTMIGPDRQKLKKCHIAVGTPGRIKQLIEFELLKTESLRLFVLDEADKLLDHKFKEQVNWIYHKLTENKQMLALSATYPEYLAQQLTRYMRDPVFVRLNRKDLALHGIKQYYKIVPGHRIANKAFEKKVEHLITLLSQVVFSQCLVFSNLQTRAQNLSDMLNFKGWPSTYISGNQEQTHRLQAMDMLKKFQCRILISTDLTARGIDAENVNLIINLDVPYDIKTYFHRIGRAGRFGTQGAAITLVSAGQEEVQLASIKKECHGKMSPLPDTLPSDLVTANLSPQDLGYTAASDSDDEDNLDEETSQLEFYHDQQMVNSKFQNENGNCNNSVDSQDRTIAPVACTNQVQNGFANGTDSNVTHRYRKSSRKESRKPGIDVGCQVKPDPLADIVGIGNIDFKIPSLATYRKPRREHWTYEKAKRDLEVFLDPSKVSSLTNVSQGCVKGEETADPESASVPAQEKNQEPCGEQVVLKAVEDDEESVNVCSELQVPVPESNIEIGETSEQTIGSMISDQKVIDSVNAEYKNPDNEGQTEDIQSVTCEVDPKDTYESQTSVPEVRTRLPNATASSVLNSTTKGSNTQANDIPDIKSHTSTSSENTQDKGSVDPVKQGPAKTVTKKSEPRAPRALSVGHMLQQIQHVFPKGDELPTANPECGEKDPVWQMYRKHLPPRTVEETVSVTSNKNKSTKPKGGAGSRESDDSSSETQDSSSGSCDSESESEGSSSGSSESDDVDDSDSNDESSESESEEETEACDDIAAGQFESDVRYADKNYEDQICEDMENMAFSQYGAACDQGWYGNQSGYGNTYDQNWYRYGESNPMATWHDYTESQYYSAPYYPGYQ